MRFSTKSGSAFSLVEVAITTAVVGIIASLTLIGVGHVFESSKREKLISDVQTLNRGVIAFRASGGDLSDIENPIEVLNTLKQTTSKRAPGLSGSKIDPRVVFVFQTAKEAASAAQRVYWNASSQSFRIADAGNTPGIKGIEFSTTAGEKDYGTSDGNHAMLYAAEDDWIWDYQEVAPSAPDGPSNFAVNSVPDDTTPATPTTSLPPATPRAKLPLAPPVFSIPSSSLPFPTFDLSLFLTNPNPPGVSEIYYSIDYGNWLPYAGSVIVPPDANIAAQAVAVNSRYSNSARVDHSYEALPVSLVPPLISPSRTTLGVFAERTSRVVITDPNDPTISKLEYQLNAGGWQPYTGEFTINRNNFPDGVIILARATPRSSPYHTTSSSTSSRIGAESISITGEAVGSFHNPAGGGSMITNLTGGTSGSFFEWGLADSAGYSTSTLDYIHSSFSAPTVGASFAAGSLDYYNGTIVSGTGADSIQLSVDLDLNVNGRTAQSTFDFDFDLVNVLNQNDPNNPWLDADFVKLANPFASESILIDGIAFNLKLEFGETTTSGISLFDEFHVLENKGARTALYGTLVEVGSIRDDDDDDDESHIVDLITGTVGGGTLGGGGGGRDDDDDDDRESGGRDDDDDDD